MAVGMPPRQVGSAPGSKRGEIQLESAEVVVAAVGGVARHDEPGSVSGGAFRRAVNSLQLPLSADRIGRGPHAGGQRRADARHCESESGQRATLRIDREEPLTSKTGDGPADAPG